MAVIIIAGGLGSTVWFISYRKRLAQGKITNTKKKRAERLPFRWKYIVVPLAILLLSIILTACFYHLLPSEVAVHFELDGTPDRWLSREMAIVGVLVSQLLLVLLAGTIVWGITKIVLPSGQTGSAWVKPERIVSYMGNLIALPQLLVCFAMIDIFSYNSYQTHLIPIWIFLIAILFLATIALGIFVFFAFSRARG